MYTLTRSPLLWPFSFQKYLCPIWGGPGHQLPSCHRTCDMAAFLPDCFQGRLQLLVSLPCSTIKATENHCMKWAEGLKRGCFSNCSSDSWNGGAQRCVDHDWVLHFPQIWLRFDGFITSALCHQTHPPLLGGELWGRHERTDSVDMIGFGWAMTQTRLLKQFWPM